MSMRPGGRRSRSGQRWVSGGFDKLFAHLPVWRAHGRVEAWRGTSVLRTVPAARSRRHGDRLSPSPPFGGGHWAAADGRSSSRSAPVSAAAGLRREQQRPMTSAVLNRLRTRVRLTLSPHGHAGADWHTAPRTSPSAGRDMGSWSGPLVGSSRDVASRGLGPGLSDRWGDWCSTSAARHRSFSGRRRADRARRDGCVRGPGRARSARSSQTAMLRQITCNVVIATAMAMTVTATANGLPSDVVAIAPQQLPASETANRVPDVVTYDRASPLPPRRPPGSRACLSLPLTGTPRSASTRPAEARPCSQQRRGQRPLDSRTGPASAPTARDR